MKYINVVQAGVVLAEFNWETKEFTYGDEFFKLHGDFFDITDGNKSSVFNEVPYFMIAHMPTRGSLNFNSEAEKHGIDSEDLFSLITKVFNKPMASYKFEGVER